MTQQVQIDIMIDKSTMQTRSLTTVMYKLYCGTSSYEPLVHSEALAA